jgi:hypothetical protein
MRAKKAAPNVTEKTTSAATERWERTRGGRVARSPSLIRVIVRMMARRRIIVSTTADKTLTGARTVSSTSDLS